MYQESYQKYLQSAWWRGYRIRKLKSVGYKCERCQRYARQCHHKRYSDSRGSILGRETLEDTEALCRACHRGHHFPEVVAVEKATSLLWKIIKWIFCALLWTLKMLWEGICYLCLFLYALLCLVLGFCGAKTYFSE